MRPTLSDLAREAGVSTATVDRVLNDRPNVAPRTRALVEAVARRIGYLPEQGEAAPVHLAALLPAGTNRFIRDLRDRLAAQAAALPGVSLGLHLLPGLDPAGQAAALDRLAGIDGVIVVALNHRQVRAAIDRLAARAVPVVTLASDLPGSGRLAYVGVDNEQAGRLAGQVIARFLGPRPQGTVAFFAGSLAYRGHQEREMGLRQILAEEAPGLALLDLRESREDGARARALAADLLRAHPDLAAIYNAGGGTNGIAQALEAAGRACDVTFIAHEALPGNLDLLQTGTLDAVIDQDAAAAAREALALLVAQARGRAHLAAPPRLNLILRENIPRDLPATPPAP